MCFYIQKLQGNTLRYGLYLWDSKKHHLCNRRDGSLYLRLGLVNRCFHERASVAQLCDQITNRLQGLFNYSDSVWTSFFISTRFLVTLQNRLSILSLSPLYRSMACTRRASCDTWSGWNVGDECHVCNCKTQVSEVLVVMFGIHSYLNIIKHSLCTICNTL